MRNKRQIILNIIANVFAMLVSTGINFFLTPYITRTVGVAAYGFVPLAGNFVSYVAIITTAFNSMGSRFITVSLQKEDKREAVEYFSTIFFMNIGLAVIVGAIFTFLLAFLTKLIQIPSELTTDIVILFALSFASTVFSLIMNAFATATFCKNRLDLKSIVSMISTIVRAVLLIVLFGLFPAKVYYIGIANISVNLIEGSLNYVIQKKIMSELQIDKNSFRKEHIRTLFASGVWNSVSQLSSILMTGLDLLVANIFLNPADSGVLSIAKIMPSLLYTGISLIVTAFGPQFVIDYANNEKSKSLLGTMDFSAKLISFCSVVPVAGFIGFGKEFFHLWVPEQNANLLYTLAVLTMIGDAVSYPVKAFDNIFAAVNKLRWPAMATLACGFLNVTLMIPLLKYTDWGLYAVAGTSTFLLALKDIFFKIPYIARIVNINPLYFLKYVFQYLISAMIIIGMSVCMKNFIPVSSWLILILDAGLVALISSVINYFLLLGKRERVLLKRSFKGKFRR